MKSGRREYANAVKVLPPGLLRELQEYFIGLLWVPAPERQRVKTAGNGKRNEKIARQHQNGKSIKDIAEDMGLCQERIRQIVKRSRKKK